MSSGINSFHPHKFEVQGLNWLECVKGVVGMQCPSVHVVLGHCALWKIRLLPCYGWVESGCGCFSTEWLMWGGRDPRDGNGFTASRE